MLSDEGIQDSACACQIYTDSDPAWSAASGSTVLSRLSTAVPARAVKRGADRLLVAAGPYAGACLSGMILGSYGGIDGSMIGCAANVVIAVAKRSDNPVISTLGTQAAMAAQFRDMFGMVNVAKNPAEARRVWNEWADVIRSITRR